MLPAPSGRATALRRTFSSSVFPHRLSGCLELLLLLLLLLLELLLLLLELLELKLKQLVLKPQSAAPLGLLHDCRQIEGAGLKRRGGSEPHSR